MTIVMVGKAYPAVRFAAYFIARTKNVTLSNAQKQGVAMKQLLVGLVASIAAVSSVAMAEETAMEAASDAKQVSQAVRLSDAELDGVTAGAVLVQLFTPGPKSVFQTHGANVIAINAFGQTNNPRTSGVIVIGGRVIDIPPR